MSSTILSTLRGLDDDNEKELKSYFDDIMSRAPADDHEYLGEIVNTLIQISSKCINIIDHPFFIRIRHAFINNLKKSADNFTLSCRIGELFSQVTNHTNDKNIQLVREFFADSNLTKCLIESLTNLSPTSNDHLIGSIEHMIDAYHKFQDDRPTIQDDPILLTLIMPVVNFFKSNEYKNSFFQLSTKQDQLTSFQKLILVTCPTYIKSYWGQLQEEICSTIAQVTLTRASEIFEHFLPSIDNWQEPVIWPIYSLILLCQRCANEHLLSAYDLQHKKILDYVLNIVQGKELWDVANQDSTSDNRQYRVNQLFCYSTLYIYTTTFLPELRDKLKENNITPLLIRLTEAKYDKIQFHAYRTLAAVLTDNDIKQLANPAQITNVFITYLKKTIDVIVLRQRLENLLLILIQHNQIRGEFARQTDGLPLLLRCATEYQFEGTKIQLRSLNILMSLSFNSEIKVLLEKNSTFIQYLRTLATSSKSPELQKIVDGILWRLFPIYKTTETKFQYDVMISYSHRDKDLCHQIHKALVADNFRVWIDLEQMHGIMMQAMAEAIEQSRYILICMSDSYCVSPYCQAEAQYAFEKQRILIPLRVQMGYKPQGWLAFTISGRMYVDFIKLNFETAYAQLMSQFHQNPVDEKDAASRLSQPNAEDAVVERKECVVYSYPKDVLQWTPANVRDFLLDKQLNQMVPICQFMDGKILIDLYKLCCNNSPLMLQTLRSETKELHAASLSTNTYLMFLNEMKQLLPKDGSSNSTSQSQLCTLI
ncbi:unnamed protein product [Rotaria sp. Silwood2]|nr:unnamed protein product [Rotaria sp. Silwood2]CAF4360726.1 unnamed protein product [Rotaria sp. Silwood2]